MRDFDCLWWGDQLGVPVVGIDTSPARACGASQGAGMAATPADPAQSPSWLERELQSDFGGAPLGSFTLSGEPQPDAAATITRKHPISICLL